MAAKKKKKSRGSDEVISIFDAVSEHTRRVVIAIALIVAAVVLVLAATGHAGIAGSSLYLALSGLLGIGYFFLPILLIALSAAFVRNIPKSVALPKIIGASVFFISGLGLVSILSERGGGLVGALVAQPVALLLDVTAGTIVLFAVAAIALLVMLDGIISYGRLAFWRHRAEEIPPEQEPLVTGEYDDEEEDEEDPEAHEEYEEEDEETPYEDDEEEDVYADDEEVTEEGEPHPHMLALSQRAYEPPPLSLLGKDRGKPGSGDVKANANLIKRTLQNFGIEIEIDEISIGPTVTRYAIKPAEGVRLSRIVSLQNNLELALAAAPVRIEAPIPGRSLVGIEVPNSSKATIGLGALFAAPEFADSDKPLLAVLGKSITGELHVANIAKMPHALIAGATGAGKSVTIHAILLSLLFRNGPENLRFIMVDPKRVELTLYKNIPHLLTPVVTDAKKAILALKWAAKEMDRRYDILEAESVRDIESYHQRVLAPAREKLARKPGSISDEELPEPMPYIVIVIDELADLMQAYPRELEAAVVRLAQMSRAVGIHLILSTQRPSVNVITGLIKANIPTRLALQVSSQIDSRTILDAGGAERLLGAGDLLYLSGDMAKPVRLQAPYVSEDELKRVVSYLAKNYDEAPPVDISVAGENGDGGERSIFADMEEDEDSDELYSEARHIVIETGKASTSFLQRKLRVGYARAARLMDMLEERGVVGPADGSKPREVLEGADDADVSVTDDEEFDADAPENDTDRP